MSQKRININPNPQPTPPNPPNPNVPPAAPQAQTNPTATSAAAAQGAPGRPQGIGRWNNIRDAVPKVPWRERIFRMRLPIVVIGCALAGAQAVYYYMDPMEERKISRPNDASPAPVSSTQQK